MATPAHPQDRICTSKSKTPQVRSSTASRSSSSTTPPAPSFPHPCKARAPNPRSPPAGARRAVPQLRQGVACAAGAGNPPQPRTRLPPTIGRECVVR
ncbi:hypothetical protein ACFPRL_03860 [Pseudoclavibacter helvolus]